MSKPRRDVQVIRFNARHPKIAESKYNITVTHTVKPTIIFTLTDEGGSPPAYVPESVFPEQQAVHRHYGILQPLIDWLIKEAPCDTWENVTLVGVTDIDRHVLGLDATTTDAELKHSIMDRILPVCPKPKSIEFYSLTEFRSREGPEMFALLTEGPHSNKAQVAVVPVFHFKTKMCELDLDEFSVLCQLNPLAIEALSPRGINCPLQWQLHCTTEWELDHVREAQRCVANGVEPQLGGSSSQTSKSQPGVATAAPGRPCRFP